MNDIFISKIQINEVRNIRNFEIPIAGNELKHLIITGKNGSGKTSLLLDLKKFLWSLKSNQYVDIEGYKREKIQVQKHLFDLEQQEKTLGIINRIAYYTNKINKLIANIGDFNNLDTIFNNPKYLFQKIGAKKFILKYFDAKRNAQPKNQQASIK